MKIAAILLLLTFALSGFAQNQTFDSEQQWRDALSRSEADRASARKQAWTGVVILGGSLGMAGYALASPRQQYSYACLGIVCSTRTSEKINWAVFAPGLALGGFGVFFTVQASSKSGAAQKRIQQLREDGAARGWRAQLFPSRHQIFSIAYRW